MIKNDFSILDIKIFWNGNNLNFKVYKNLKYTNNKNVHTLATKKIFCLTFLNDSPNEFKKSREKKIINYIWNIWLP